MSAPTSSPAAKIATVPNTCYPFAERATALIGVSLDSLGNIAVLGRSRTDLLKPMVDRFTADPVTAPNGDIKFTFTLAEKNADKSKKVGLFATEVAGWIKSYEINRVHFLGHPEPFGSDELPYGSKRSQTIPANRTFTCTYSPNGDVLLEDGQKSVKEHIYISSMDDPATNFTGKIFIVVRVAAADFEDLCVKLEFHNGFAFDGQTKGGIAFKNKTEFSLNQSVEMP